LDLSVFSEIVSGSKFRLGTRNSTPATTWMMLLEFYRRRRVLPGAWTMTLGSDNHTFCCYFQYYW
jgi:hypothetical protein